MNYEHWDFSLYDFIILSGSCTGAGFAVGWLFYDSMVLGAAAAVLLFLFAKVKYVQWRISSRRAELLLQFRDVLYSSASSISAGRSMGQALEESLEFWKGTYGEKDLIMVELRYMVHQIKEAGVQDLEVLWDFAERSGLAEVTDFVMVYENCRGSGANLVQAMDRAAAVISDRIGLERELETLMAQKQFEGRVIMAAPFLLMMFLKVSSPEFLEPLTSTSQGRLVSSLALGLIGCAYIVTERVNRLAF